MAREPTPEDRYLEALREARVAALKAQAAMYDAENISTKHNVGRPGAVRDIAEWIRRALGKLDDIIR